MSDAQARARARRAGTLTSRTIRLPVPDGPLAVLLAWLSLPLALRATRRVFVQTGRALNSALVETGQTAIAYSALFALGLLLAR